MDLVLLMVIATWVALNGYVAFKGFVFLRLQGIHAPDATNEDMARWVRGNDSAEDLPEAMRPALDQLRTWRAVARKYFLFSVVVIISIFTMRFLGNL